MKSSGPGIFIVGRFLIVAQPLNPNLHAVEGEPFLAQVLQRGPDMIDGVVDAEEAVGRECWNVSSFATGHNL